MNGAGYGIAGAMGIYAKLLDQQNKDAKFKQLLGGSTPGATVTPSAQTPADSSWKLPGLDTPAQPAPNALNGVAGSTNQALLSADQQIVQQPASVPFTGSANNFPKDLPGASANATPLQWYE